MRIFPDPEPVTQVCAIRARNSVPDAGLSDVLTPRRQGVFLRPLYRGGEQNGESGLLLLRKRRCQVGQLTEVLIPSLLVPVQPLLPGLGNLAPGHQVPGTG